MALLSPAIVFIRSSVEPLASSDSCKRLGVRPQTEAGGGEAAGGGCCCLRWTPPVALCGGGGLGFCIKTEMRIRIIMSLRFLKQFSWRSTSHLSFEQMPPSRRY